jgi:hypothetical protein
MANAANPQYAIDMFSICVSGDPGNVVFLQAFLAALRKKFGTKKAGGLTSLFSAGSRAGLKRLAAGAKWRELLAQGVDILKGNPADYGCLLSMAEACGNLMFFDCQAVYLRAALDAAPADAKQMATDPLGPVPADLDVDLADLAAWTVVANVILNLDETFMCP